MLLHCVGQLVLQPSLAHSQTNVNRDAKQALMQQSAQLSGRKEKKRKDYVFRRQSSEKPNIILGCPVSSVACKQFATQVEV